MALNLRSIFAECGFEPAKTYLLNMALNPRKYLLNMALNPQNNIVKYGFEPAKKYLLNNDPKSTPR